MRKFQMMGFILTCATLLGGCGSGIATTDTATEWRTPTTSGAANVQSIVVDSGPAAAGGTANEPFVSVTICSPADASNCQTIDHILVDSGSFGFRVISSVLNTSLTLPQQTDSSGNAVVECTEFADGYSWGSIRTVNLQIAGETATALPIQVIGDPNYASLVPLDCSGAGPSENTVATFGANGVLGVGPFAQDCGSACADSAIDGWYYACSSSTCQPISMALTQQVQNPITLFQTDNNGLIISLPSVPGSGSGTVSGTITFGVGTQTNNGLGSATVYTADSEAYFTTVYKNVTYADSLLDSGSNGLFFNDSSIPQCSDGSGFYCPSSTLSLSAINMGENGTSGTVDFEVGNEANMFSDSSLVAFPELAGTNGDPSGFDWGLPFFFGRNVYFVIQGYPSPGGTGPYFAY